MKKTLAVLMAVAMVGAAFAGPVEAKKKKKKKKPPVCQPYVPGELGAEAETVVLTDEATAEAPATFAFSLPEYFLEGLDGGQPSEVVNVQVDSKMASAGLYATFAFPARRDYDLFARWPSGDEAASSHGFNPLVEADVDTPVGNPSNTATNHAGESHADSENIVGLITPDCGGYTFEMLNYFGEGGDFELQLWLGEGTEEPLAPPAP